VLLCSTIITLIDHVFIITDFFISFCILIVTFLLQHSQPFIFPATVLQIPFLHQEPSNADLCYHCQRRSVVSQLPVTLSCKLLGTEPTAHVQRATWLSQRRGDESWSPCYGALPCPPASPSAHLRYQAWPLAFSLEHHRSLQSLNKAGQDTLLFPLEDVLHFGI